MMRVGLDVVAVAVTVTVTVKGGGGWWTTKDAVMVGREGCELRGRAQCAHLRTQ